MYILTYISDFCTGGIFIARFYVKKYKILYVSRLLQKSIHCSNAIQNAILKLPSEAKFPLFKGAVCNFYCLLLPEW